MRLRRRKVQKVCYILSYRCPDYIRTRTLLSALKRIQNIELIEAINKSRGFLRYIQTISSLLSIRICKNPRLYILGFRGYEIYFIVRLITIGKILVFDHMMSPYDSLVSEKKSINKGGVLDRLICCYEKCILCLSDIILTDTILHRDFYIQKFNVPPQKIIEIPVGTDEETFHASSLPFNKKHDNFNVLFYGTFLPLHGVEIILMAAHVLRDSPIQFKIIGGKGRNLKFFYNLIYELGLSNVHHEMWVPYDILPQMIHDADVCLGGPFSGTGQAKRVISGKTFQSLAMAKATIIGQIDHDYGFVDKKNCLIVRQASHTELADKIVWCFENREKLHSLGENGYTLYKERFSIEHIKQILQDRILC